MNDSRSRAKFFHKAYQFWLLVAATVAVGLAIYGVRIVISMDHKIDCIAIFFTQDQRTAKKITLDQCKIVRAN